MAALHTLDIFLSTSGIEFMYDSTRTILQL